MKFEFSKCSNKGAKPFNLETITKENTGHGRIEKRTCKVITAKEGKILTVNPLSKWPGLTSIIEINSMRINIKS